MKTFGLFSALALCIALGPTVAAHHSAVQFDFTKTASITGVVKKFEAINPHMRLVLTVSDQKGSREIEFEGHSTNNMHRAGYRHNMIKVGDKITVIIAPLRNGSDESASITTIVELSLADRSSEPHLRSRVEAIGAVVSWAWVHRLFDHRA